MMIRVCRNFSADYKTEAINSQNFHPTPKPLFKRLHALNYYFEGQHRGVPTGLQRSFIQFIIRVDPESFSPKAYVTFFATKKLTYYKVLRQRIACSIYQGKKQSEKDGERKHELKKEQERGNEKSRLSPFFSICNH